jgi:hypothetical protein
LYIDIYLSKRNQKLSLFVIVAITVFVATAATATVLSPTPADADQPSYRKGNECFISKKQCEKKSPGKSGKAQCD